MKKIVYALVFGAPLLASCNHLEIEGNKSVSQIDEAASLHTSITSITPWADIKDRLKPNFALSASDALNKSIPTTLLRRDQILDILRIQASLAPAISQLTSTTTTSSGTGKDLTTATDTKAEKSSPAPPTATPPSSLLASAPAQATLSTPDSVADTLLQYQSAANLLRDVAVMNSEIENVSKRRGQDAYLTRIQVTVMPLRHGLGYVTYANLSMFASTGTVDPNSGAPVSGELLEGTPFVVPILSTDSLQATRRSQSATTAQEIALALNILQTAGSVGASGGKSHQHESDAAGNDLEAVVTVGRMSDNTIRIRMGADPLPGGGYGMVPRTFNVSAVVFLPKKASEIHYVSRLSLHHVTTGSELSDVRTPTYDDSVDEIAHRYEFFFNDKEAAAALSMKTKLNAYAFNSDMKSFMQEIKTLATYDSQNHTEFDREAMYIWSELIALNRHAHFAFSTVDIPKPDPMVFPPASQLVVYAVNDKALTVQLAMGAHLRSPAVDARLVLRPCAPPTPPEPKSEESKKKTKAKKSSGRTAQTSAKGGTTPDASQDKPETAPASCTPVGNDEFQVAATSVTSSDDGRSLTLTFPPIAQLTPVADGAKAMSPTSVVLATYDTSGPTIQPVTYTFSAIRKTKQDADKDSAAAASLTPESRVVIADKSRKGRIVFTVQGGTKKNLKAVVHQSVLTFTDDAGKVVSHKGSAWDVEDGGRYVVNLDNLSTSAVVQIELVTQPDDSKPSTLFNTEVRVEQISQR